MVANQQESECAMSAQMYQPTTPEQARYRKELAPGVHDAFEGQRMRQVPDGRRRRPTLVMMAAMETCAEPGRWR